MKKFICLLLVLVSLFALVACGEESTGLPAFADCEIGYQLEVYPKVAFDYKISEDCIVHIESITATLTAKNVINEGDLIESTFYPFEVTISVSGYVYNPVPTNTALKIVVTGFVVDLIIHPDGQFSNSTTSTNISQNQIVYFVNCYSVPIYS